ncbi:MAG: TauD/TfdA family dioxygenase [Alphaproteobacteria bacterium]|nr:TauD/TfdA family dioxygenase [Alphaproteobacteria bacterium]
MAATIAFEPLAGGFGAECRGHDLARMPGSGDRDAILAAFLSHHLLVFRGQSLSADRMRDFAAIFGEVEGNIFRKPDGSTLEDVHLISNLGADGLPNEDSYIKSNYNWHTDKSYLPVPALMTMLQAIELPPSGGDTEFADMTRAYAALAEDTRRDLVGLEVVHSFEYMRSSTNDRPLTEAERAATPPVHHPLVRTHPETGEKSLYLGMYCSHVVGMDEAEGRALVRRLQAHATQSSFVYAHRWQPGDLVLWDNRCLLHRATMGYDAKRHRRVLQRAVVKGTRPV